MTDAYTQLNLHPDSQELCVLNTHRGLYKLRRLIYGVNSAAAIFQSTMDLMLKLEKHYVRLRLDRCLWFVQKLEFLGFTISALERAPSDSLINDIVQAKAPSDLKQLRCKKLLLSSELLMHFDPELPILLYTDASPVGVGCVLAHVVKVDGKIRDRPICFASATLTPAQQNYAQVDREALGVIFGVTKFYKFLWDRQFTIDTDNSAIQRILSPDKGLPLRTNLQHWATILQGFNYD
ncbi:hypothetical protein FOCC_FOCC012814 [Frankliniella occidentalis]|nr:hypothetical protein FOCC_FOCC012814 [Frankliniella occidentalis]